METLQTVWRLGPGRGARRGALAQLEKGSLGEGLVLAPGAPESRDPLQLRVECNRAVIEKSPKGRSETALIDLSSILTAPVRVAVNVQDKGQTTEPKTRVLGCDEVAQEVKAAVPVRATGGVGETTHLRDALADI
jgi:hypothetical protein